MNDIPCPTCGATGDEQCVRGRKPIDRGGIVGAIWSQQTPFPQGHDSRRTANKENNLQELLELAGVIGDKVAFGQLPPQDKNGFYIL